MDMYNMETTFAVVHSRFVKGCIMLCWEDAVVLHFWLVNY